MITRARRMRRKGFSLVEVLVVVSIIAALAAILIPSLSQARGQARRAVCLSQLRQIGAGVMTYTNAFGDLLPDPFILGRHALRRAPGQRTPGDPVALPERYGLAAALGHRSVRAMPVNSRVWVCPDAPGWMQEGGCSYAFAFSHPGYNFTTDPARRRYWNKKYATIMSGMKSLAASYEFVWDNYNFDFALTGFFGPFKGYTLDADRRIYPHSYSGMRFWNKPYARTNALYLDMHVAQRKE